MIMISISQEVLWAAASLILLLVFSLRSSGLIVLSIIGLVLGFMLNTPAQLMWLILVMVVLGVFILKPGRGAGPEAYSPRMLMGG